MSMDPHTAVGPDSVVTAQMGSSVQEELHSLRLTLNICTQWAKLFYPLLQQIAANQSNTAKALAAIQLAEKNMANDLDTLLSDAQDESTVDDSIIALLGSVKSQLDSVLAGNLTPDQQAKVDAVFNQLEANKAKVGAAVVANTPAAPSA